MVHTRVPQPENPAQVAARLAIAHAEYAAGAAQAANSANAQTANKVNAHSHHMRRHMWRHGIEIRPGQFLPAAGSSHPLNPRDARQDTLVKNIEAITHLQGSASALGYHIGADAAGRAVLEFPVQGIPSSLEAAQTTAHLKKVAKFVKKSGLANIVGGPVGALATGESIVLRWGNGIAVTAAL